MTRAQAHLVAALLALLFVLVMQKIVSLQDRNRAEPIEGRREVRARDGAEKINIPQENRICFK